MGFGRRGSVVRAEQAKYSGHSCRQRAEYGDANGRYECLSVIVFAMLPVTDDLFGIVDVLKGERIDDSTDQTAGGGTRVQ